MPFASSMRARWPHGKRYLASKSASTRPTSREEAGAGGGLQIFPPQISGGGEFNLNFFHSDPRIKLRPGGGGVGK